MGTMREHPHHAPTSWIAEKGVDMILQDALAGVQFFRSTLSLGGMEWTRQQFTPQLERPHFSLGSAFQRSRPMPQR
jgi:hypothetical protein